MQDFILAHRDQIAELCRKHHVLRLSIFGSAARDDFNPATSDVDVIVDFDKMPIEIYARNKRAFYDSLTSLLDRRVDLLTWASIRNPYLIREIQQSNELLYAA